LTKLTTLDVADNELRRLPVEMGQLTNLTDLDVRFNEQLAGPLPDALLTLPLDSFSLNNTQLCIPTEPQFAVWLDEIQALENSGILTCTAED